MGGPDPRIPAAPGSVPVSAAVNPLNKVQASPVIAQQQATPSLAALLGTQTTQPVTPTVPSDSGGTSGYTGYREWMERKYAPRYNEIF